MDLGIAGKVAVVTAASKGLGRASAQALSEEGAKVLISSRNKDSLEAAAAQMPGEVAVVPADMDDPETPQRLVDEAVSRWGAVHIAVANNGGPPPGRALDLQDDAIQAAVNANFLSTVRLVRAAVPHMRQAGWGRICCITSVSVKQPMPVLALSNASRTALWSWAKTAAQDLFPDGITLNLACPGTHDTERIRALSGGGGGGGRGPIGDPGDFGKIVAFLCSEQAKFVTGTALGVDGGAVAGLL